MGSLLTSKKWLALSLEGEAKGPEPLVIAVARPLVRCPDWGGGGSLWSEVVASGGWLLDLPDLQGRLQVRGPGLPVTDAQGY